MEHTFNYAIIVAVPDPRKGERVNIGVIVFKGGNADVRFRYASSKLKAITGSTCDEHIESVRQRLTMSCKRFSDPKDVIASFMRSESIFCTTKLGWFSISDEADYENRVSSIMDSLIWRPSEERREAQTRINTEIADVFRRANVLAQQGESIETGKIVRDFKVDVDEDLTADFVLKNTRLHVTSTLDLRRKAVSRAQAALKSVILDKSHRNFDNVNRIAVYAVDPAFESDFKSHIGIMRDYSDVSFNWSSPIERAAFQKSLYDAISHNDLGSKYTPGN